MKNLIVAQSGGPTSAINATLAGVIAEAQKSDEIDKIYGSYHGIQGVLEENFVDLNQKIDSQDKIDILKRTPAAALGSCRFKLDDPEKDDTQFRKIVDILHKHNIGYFVYIGGNDSMDTVHKLSVYCEKNGIDDIKVIGGPKTIDNDLCGIDHCPGFGSAAKYIATVFAELEQEINVYETKSVIIVEMMGRNAGWLTAAAALAENKNGTTPYLIYLEERTFSMDKFIADVKEKLETGNTVLVAVSEGVHDENGRYICDIVSNDNTTDVFGHSMLSGTGRVLEDEVKNKIGCKVRSIELNLLQRCASHIMSETDINESFNLGKNAVRIALAGETGRMSSLKRTSSDKYEVEYCSVDIANVANLEKKVPDLWINETGNGVTEEMIKYLSPLVQGELSCYYNNGIPEYLLLK